MTVQFTPEMRDALMAPPNPEVQAMLAAQLWQLVRVSGHVGYQGPGEIELTWCLAGDPSIRQVELVRYDTPQEHVDLREKFDTILWAREPVTRPLQ